MGIRLMRKFESELAEIKSRLNEMAVLTIEMVEQATTAVKERRPELMDIVAESEERLDQMQTDIDHEAVRMLTVYGPVASQLRYILVINHVTAQMERIGDQVMNVFESLQLMRGEAEHSVVASLNRMADLTSEMVRDSIDAYFQEDADKAMVTRSHDDLVDQLNLQIIQKLLSDEVLHGVLKGTSDLADAVAQILIARQLERIADQAVNICKEVVFMVQGKDVRHSGGEPEQMES